MSTQSLIVDQTDTGGIIDLNGGAVTTGAGQIYDGTVKLTSGNVLSDTEASAISFGPAAAVSAGAIKAGGGDGRNDDFWRVREHPTLDSGQDGHCGNH